jgi:hypothetical protein
LCKDVQIRVFGLDTRSGAEKQHFQQKLQSSRGGILGFLFSYDTTTTSATPSDKTSYTIADDGLRIIIPGSQILGYVQEILPRDLSSTFMTAEDNY